MDKENSWNLDWFGSKAEERVNERLCLDEGSSGINPSRHRLYRSLSLIKPEDVRVAIFGQDPYPQGRFATGVAFSIPSEVPPEDFPPTLRTIFGEYNRDLGLPVPSSGNLEQWSSNGVLLWNVIPSTKSGQSLAHDWAEYASLTGEIIRRLGERGIVMAFLGAISRRFVEHVDLTKNEVIVTSHPSPRGSMNSNNPFVGSRLFSTINDKLVSNGLEMVDWKLK